MSKPAEKPIEVIDNKDFAAVASDEKALHEKYPRFAAAAEAARAEIERRHLKFKGLVVHGHALYAKGSLARQELRTIDYKFV